MSDRQEKHLLIWSFFNPAAPPLSFYSPSSLFHHPQPLIPSLPPPLFPPPSSHPPISPPTQSSPPLLSSPSDGLVMVMCE